jgi:hypothetical protein
MGWGDEVMVTGEVKRRAAGTARRFAILDARKGGMHRWNEAWAGNPRIARPGEPYDEGYYNHGGARPYIVLKGLRRWEWKAYGPTPGELFLSSSEAAFADAARGRVLIQPSIKDGASPNKVWPLDYWQKLVASAPSVPWLQIGAGHEPRISGTGFLPTPTFRDACGALSGARAAVLQEGGLHHAAAALGIPAVVIFGGFISPRCTGYALHRNLYTESKEYPLGCGMRTTCMHCQVAMGEIEPRLVRRELEAILGGGKS